MSEQTIANQSDAALATETAAVSIPLGIAIFFGGEAALGIGTGGGWLGGGAAAAEGAAESDAALTEAEEWLAQCFPAGTLVATPRGQIPIESLKAGEDVWAYDLVHSRWCPRPILKTYVSDHDGISAKITVGDETIEATFLHPFWVVSGEDLAERPIRDHLPRVPAGATTSGRWVDAGDVRVGDQLLLRDARILPVQAIQHQPYHDKVYNFHVPDFQCYAVGRNCALVHNINGAPFGEGGGVGTNTISYIRSQMQTLENQIIGADAAGDTAAVLQYQFEWNQLNGFLQTVMNGGLSLN